MLRRLAGLVLLAGLLPACRQQPADAVPTTAPATMADRPPPHSTRSRSTRLDGFVRARYGNAAGLAHGWHGEVDGQAVDSAVCAEQPVVIGAQVQQLLAVCHSLSDAGDGTPGMIDFVVLRDDGDAYAVVAEDSGENFGSSGRPGRVDILRLGSDFYGFAVTSAWIGQGLLLESQDLVVPGPKGLVKAAWLRRHIDNHGALACDDADGAAEHDQDDCRAQGFDVDFVLTVDASDAQARSWPLTIRERGTACGAPVAATHVLRFDVRSWTYPIPDTLQREGCS